MSGSRWAMALRRAARMVGSVHRARGGSAADAVARAMRGLPLVDVDMLTAGQPLLVLAPHPDDESIGCGGAVAAARARGTDVRIVVLTDGTGSHPRSRSYPSARLRALREIETREAAACLGVAPDSVRFLRLPDGAAPAAGAAFAEAAAVLIELVRSHAIHTMITTSIRDSHPDHKASFRLAGVVREATGVRLYSYPVWSVDARARRNESGSLRIDVSAHLASKRRAIAAHRSQTTNLIDDDPTGFRLAPSFLELFDRPFEIFVEAPPGRPANATNRHRPATADR